MNPEIQTPKTSTNNDTIMAALACLPLVGLIFYFAMPDASPFVRYYARQGTGLFAAEVLAWILISILGFIPVLGGVIGLIINLALFVTLIVLIVNALQNKMFRVPVLSDLVDQYIK